MPSFRFGLFVALLATAGCATSDDLTATVSLAAGTFEETETIEKLGIPYTLTGPALTVPADLDRDGAVDVVVLPRGGYGAVALQAAGGGPLELQAGTVPGKGARYAAADDLDLDGDVDLVVTCGPCGSGELPWFVQNQWAQTGRVTMGGGMLPGDSALNAAIGPVVTLDVDGDRDLDLLALSVTPGVAGAVFEMRGGVLRRAPAAVPTSLSGATGAAAVDLDGDGVREVYVVRPGADAIIGVTLAAVTDRSAQLGLGGDRGELAVAAGDLDRDGLGDVVTLGADGGPGSSAGRWRASRCTTCRSRRSARRPGSRWSTCRPTDGRTWW